MRTLCQLCKCHFESTSINEQDYNKKGLVVVVRFCGKCMDKIEYYQRRNEIQPTV